MRRPSNGYEQIGAVILPPGAGVTGFTALGEILNGTVNPSGKTVDTYIKDLMETPYINNIGNLAYTNVDDLKKQIAEEGLIKYEDCVQYPLGYGLSYTTFEKKIENFKDNGDNITFDVVVTNTGDCSWTSLI